MQKRVVLRPRFSLRWHVLYFLVAASAALAATPVFRSPQDVAFSPDGSRLAVTDASAGFLVLIDPVKGTVIREVRLKDKPGGVAWSADGTRVYAAEREGASVAEVDASEGRVLRRLPGLRWPAGVVAAGGLLAVTDFAACELRILDVAGGKILPPVPVSRMPRAVATTPDGAFAITAGSLPAGVSTNRSAACVVSIVNLKEPGKKVDITLPAGSINVFGIAVSPDGKWAYVAHNVGRFTLPTTQLERGWVNSNGFTILDLAASKIYATLLLDTVGRGSANPWGIAVAPDAKWLWIALSGTHEIARVDLVGLHSMLAQKDDAARQALSYDLAALYAANLYSCRPLQGNGPRGVAVSPDGKTVAVAMYFSAEVVLLNAEGAVAKRIAIGPQPEPTLARKGEALFHDATYCFQSWLSCATCHPGDGRADGLNWDLLNDGIGNPKNTKSLLISHKTPPVMSHGVRANMEAAALAGFRFILFREPTTNEVESVIEYVRSLAPVPSPYLQDAKLSPKAEKGKKVFESEKTGCIQCHPGPLFTDLKLYDVGTRGELDHDAIFDCPTLIELWHTPPYLHDGSCDTLRDVLTTGNKGDRHGTTSHLNAEEIDALVEYLLSL